MLSDLVVIKLCSLFGIKSNYDDAIEGYLSVWLEMGMEGVPTIVIVKKLNPDVAYGNILASLQVGDRILGLTQSFVLDVLSDDDDVLTFRFRDSLFTPFSVKFKSTSDLMRSLDGNRVMLVR